MRRRNQIWLSDDRDFCTETTIKGNFKREKNGKLILTNIEEEIFFLHSSKFWELDIRQDFQDKTVKYYYYYYIFPIYDITYFPYTWENLSQLQNLKETIGVECL